MITLLLSFAFAAEVSTCPNKLLDGGKIKNSDFEYSVCHMPASLDKRNELAEFKQRPPPIGYSATTIVTIVDRKQNVVHVSSPFIWNSHENPPENEGDNGQTFFKVEKDKLLLLISPEHCSEWIPWQQFEIRCSKQGCQHFPTKNKTSPDQTITRLIYDHARPIDTRLKEAVKKKDVSYFKEYDGKQLCQIAALAAQCDQAANDLFSNREFTEQTKWVADGGESISSLLSHLGAIRFKKSCATGKAGIIPSKKQ